MKINLITVVLILAITTIIYGQEQNSNWEKLNYLIGNWKGEGGGKPGEGEGYFSFKSDLNNKIIIRNSHSEYPATKDKPLIVHDDLMIVYFDYSGNPDRAIYFDNEGHVINYSITFPNENDIVFTSDKVPNAPIFRLTYSQIESDLLNVKFEMSQDGENFMTYVEGKSRRTK
jgi:hypothetical protein